MTEPMDGLKSVVKTLSPTRLEIEIELSPERTEKTHEEMVVLYMGRAKLPGFRPGKAPRPVVLQKFGHDIEHEVIDHLVPEALEEALTENRIRPVGIPAVEHVAYENGGPMSFKAVVDVWPEFDLPPYKKLKLQKRETAVKDEDIDRTLEELRRKNADYTPIGDRGIRDGDYVVIRIQGRDVKTKRLMPSEQKVILAGNDRNDPAVNARLPGLRAEESVDFEYPYPDDFSNRKLAGRTIAYTLKVLSVKEMLIPAADDEFAKRLGAYDSLSVLREKIREELTSARAQTVKREAAQDAVRAVVEAASIALPESAVEEETEAVLQDIASRFPARGLSPEAVEEIRAGARAQAERNLKEHLVIRKVAQAEGFVVTDEDVDAEIRAIAQANGIPAARALESFREEGRREGLKGSLLARRTVDFLVDQAIME